MHLCCYGHGEKFPVMKLLYKYGLNINVIDIRGKTVTTLCLHWDYLDQLKVIIEEWDANLTKPDGYTGRWLDPLETARTLKYLDPSKERKAKQIEIIKYLEEVYRQRNMTL